MKRYARISGRTLSLATVVRTLPPGYTAVLNYVSNASNRRILIVAGEDGQGRDAGRTLDRYIEEFTAATAGVFRAEEMSEQSARNVFELLGEVWPFGQERSA